MENENEIDKTEPAQPEQPEQQDQPTEQTEAQEQLTQEEQIDKLIDQYAEKPEEEGEGEAKNPAGDPAGDPAEKPEGDGAQPAAVTPTEKTEDDIDDELLAEVKSERGKSRIRELLSGHRALKSEYEEAKKTTNEFANILAETKLPPEGIAQTFEFCRLVGSGDEASLKTALDMLDAQRAAIYQKLGMEQPGVDPLADFEDLRNAVDMMEISEDKAVELAKLRRMQAAQQQSVQRNQELQRQQQEYSNRVQVFSQQANALFSRLQASDPAYKAKEQKIAAYLSDPAKVQYLISKFQPEQWVDQLKFMYDAIPAPVVSRTPTAVAPLRSRPSQLGTPSVTAKGGADIVSQLIDQMGI